MTSKSKKFLKVIDGLRAWNLAATISVLKSDHFHLGTVAEYGFPFQPTCMTFDPVQRILAIGTRRGCIKLFGRPGVEFHLEHPSPAEVLQLIFLVNEGESGVSARYCYHFRYRVSSFRDYVVYFRLTCGYLAVSSSWLGVGSEQGNVHFVNVQQFTTSGYVINWNKAINLYVFFNKISLSTQNNTQGSVRPQTHHLYIFNMDIGNQLFTIYDHPCIKA
ncbi:unnamed protein product [Mesocestoides corti]|uniref:Uncharacterized protein n=1 Tax=Mesocestoides corti TaxID=53468 RepID=A0A158QSZ9_MESCO|nr:unnamed protein product [Mesocestoides corti]